MMKDRQRYTPVTIITVLLSAHHCLALSSMRGVLRKQLLSSEMFNVDAHIAAVTETWLNRNVVSTGRYNIIWL